MASFREAFREAKDAGDRTFVWQGKTYSTKTAEEQGREIGSRAAAGSGRGASAGRTASDRDTRPRRAEIPTGGGAKAPADTGMGGMSDTTRNVLTTLGALGAGGGAAGLGARALMRREAAKRAAEAEKLASRVEPPMRRLRPEDVTDDLVRSVVDKAYEKTYGAGLKRGGKVKTYAKGGSVRGAGCETRTKKTRFV